MLRNHYNTKYPIGRNNRMVVVVMVEPLSSEGEVEAERGDGDTVFAPCLAPAAVLPCFLLLQFLVCYWFRASQQLQWECEVADDAASILM